MKARRLLIIGLIIAMLSISMAGLADVKVTDPGTYPITAEDSDPITLKVWRTFSSTIIQSWEDNRMYQEMEKQTGIDIQWISPPTGADQENYNLFIASGDLPDVYYGIDDNWYLGGATKALDDGVYIDLTPMIEQYAPNYLKWLNYDEQVNREARLDDGRIINLQQVQLAHEAPWSGPWIRTDLLEKVGKEMPTTIDEWHDVLTAFKDAGVAIPLGVQRDNNPLVGAWGAFSNAYGAGTDFLNVDGKVEWGFLMPGFKDFIIEMTKWYEEGLFDPDFDTRTFNDLIANFTSGNVGAFNEAYGDSAIWLMSAQKDDPDFAFKAAPYPVMNKGDDPATTLHTRQENYMVRGQKSYVTTACKIPEIALRWMDFGYTIEGFMLNNYGVEGESYVWVDGAPDEANGQYFPPELLVENKHPEWTDTMVNNPDGYEFWTMVQKYKTHNGTHLRNPNSYLIGPLAQESMVVWAAPGTDWFIPQIAMTSEEQRRDGELRTDLEAYRNEMIFKYVKGLEPIDSWDTFIANMKSMGADERVAIRQAALDRYMSRN